MKEEEGVVLDDYAGGEIKEYANTTVPTFLKCVYVIMPIFGIVWTLTFWNGSAGWFDRGYWYELENAANTTQEGAKRIKKEREERSNVSEAIHHNFEEGRV